MGASGSELDTVPSMYHDCRLGAGEITAAPRRGLPPLRSAPRPASVPRRPGDLRAGARERAHFRLRASSLSLLCAGRRVSCAAGCYSSSSRECQSSPVPSSRLRSRPQRLIDAAPADPANAMRTFGANDMPPGTKVLAARQGVAAGADRSPSPRGASSSTTTTAATSGTRYRPGSIHNAAGGAGAASDGKPANRVLATFQGRLMLADGDAGRRRRVAHPLRRLGPPRPRSSRARSHPRPFTSASGRAVGESLMVEVNGTQLPAR